MADTGSTPVSSIIMRPNWVRASRLDPILLSLATDYPKDRQRLKILHSLSLGERCPVDSLL